MTAPAKPRNRHQEAFVTPERGGSRRDRPRNPKVRRARAYSDEVQNRRLVLPLSVNRAAIRMWRRKRYLGQADLAALIDISWMTVARWEGGESNIPSYMQLVLERLDEIMLWHPDGPRLKEGQVVTPLEVAN